MTDTLSATPRLSALAALQYRDFAVYASARFCATLAWQILGAAVGYQIYQLTRDPLALAFVGLAQFLPFVLCVLPAGQIADRYDRRLVLICAYIVEALCAAALLWFTLSGLKIVWPMFVAMTCFGAGRAFWMPTGQAITPNLVPRAAFPSAVAVNSTLFQSGVIIGPALSGLLLYWGTAAAYFAVVALLIVVVVLMITIQPVRASVQSQPFRFGDLLEGLRFVFQRRTVLGAISLDLFAVLFGGATAMMPIYASDILHVGPIGYGFLRAAPGVGAALIAAVLAFSPIQRQCRTLDVLRRGALRVLDDCLRCVDRFLGVADCAVPAWRGRHDQRVRPASARAARNTGCHSRACERGELHVHRCVE